MLQESVAGWDSVWLEAYVVRCSFAFRSCGSDCDLCVGTKDCRLVGKSDRGFTIVRGVGFQIIDLLQALDGVWNV